MYDLPAEIYENIAESLDMIALIHLRSTSLRAYVGCSRAYRRHTAARRIQRWWKFRNYPLESLTPFERSRNYTLNEYAYTEGPYFAIHTAEGWWRMQNDREEVRRRGLMHYGLGSVACRWHELWLPFHVLHGVLVEGKNVRSVRFSVQMRRLGWHDQPMEGLYLGCAPGPGFNRLNWSTFRGRRWKVMFACTPIPLWKYSGGGDTILLADANRGAQVVSMVPLVSFCPSDIRGVVHVNTGPLPTATNGYWRKGQRFYI